MGVPLTPRPGPRRPTALVGAVVLLSALSVINALTTVLLVLSWRDAQTHDDSRAAVFGVLVLLSLVATGVYVAAAVLAARGSTTAVVLTGGMLVLSGVSTLFALFSSGSPTGVLGVALTGVALALLRRPAVTTWQRPAPASLPPDPTQPYARAAAAPPRRTGVPPAVLVATIAAAVVVLVLLVAVLLRGRDDGRAAAATGPSATAAPSTTLSAPTTSTTPSGSSTDPLVAPTPDPSESSSQSPSEDPSESPSEDPSSEPTDDLGLAVDVSKGDCIARLPSDASEVFTVRIVDCGTPHEAQVGATFSPDLASYPSTAELNAILNRECPARINRVLRADAPASLVWIGYYPLEAAWKAGDHSFKCLVERKDGTPLTRSVITS